MKRRLLAVAGFVIASTLVAAPAVAQQYPPAENYLTLSDTTLVSGQPLTIAAGTFLDGTTVSFTFNSAPVTLGAATANADGRATLSAPIPANATPGQHTITASGESVNGPLEVSAAVTISGGAADAPATTNAAELPPTGVGAVTLTAGVVAVIALALGGVLMLVARRRRYANT